MPTPRIAIRDWDLEGREAHLAYQRANELSLSLRVAALISQLAGKPEEELRSWLDDMLVFLFSIRVKILAKKISDADALSYALLILLEVLPTQGRVGGLERAMVGAHGSGGGAENKFASVTISTAFAKERRGFREADYQSHLCMTLHCFWS